MFRPFHLHVIRVWFAGVFLVLFALVNCSEGGGGTDTPLPPTPTSIEIAVPRITMLSGDLVSAKNKLLGSLEFHIRMRLLSSRFCLSSEFPDEN